MELLEGIKSRKSIRAFKPEPVSEQVLMELLEVATRAPSGVNFQPWEFFVVRGEMLEELKRENLEEHRLGKAPDPDIPVDPIKGVSPVLGGVYRERQVELAKQIFQLMGITKEDKKKREAWNEKMVQFYDAPAVIILVVDKAVYSPWRIIDIGAVTQNIALAAQEYGLGTCIMRAVVDHPEKVRKVVGIPESKRIAVGIAIGHPDWDHPINRLKTNREKIDKIVTWKTKGQGPRKI